MELCDTNCPLRNAVILRDKTSAWMTAVQTPTISQLNHFIQVLNGSSDHSDHHWLSWIVWACWVICYSPATLDWDLRTGLKEEASFIFHGVSSFVKVFAALFCTQNCIQDSAGLQLLYPLENCPFGFWSNMKVEASAVRMKPSVALCDEEGVEGPSGRGGGAVVGVYVCVCRGFSGRSPLLPVMLSRH